MLHGLFEQAKTLLSKTFSQSLASKSRQEAIAHVLQVLVDILRAADVGGVLIQKIKDKVEEQMIKLPPGCNLETNVRPLIAKAFVELLKTRQQKEICDANPIAVVFPDFFASMTSLQPRSIKRARFGTCSKNSSLVSPPPLHILTTVFVGLQGCGKTTSLCKLAYYFGVLHRIRVGIIGADMTRAGAFEQLEQNVARMYANKPEKRGRRVVLFPNPGMHQDAATVVKQGLEWARELQLELVLVDTAGRNEFDDKDANELEKIVEAASPDRVAMVIDGKHGQLTAMHALKFRSSIPNVDFFAILSKMDAGSSNKETSRGGGALTAVVACNIPVLFAGTGEHMQNLVLFSAEVFVCQLLQISWEKVAAIDKKARNTQSVFRQMGEAHMNQFLQNFSDQNGAVELMKELEEEIQKHGSKMWTFGILKRFLKIMPLTHVKPQFFNVGLSEPTKLTQAQFRAILNSMNREELACDMKTVRTMFLRKKKHDDTGKQKLKKRPPRPTPFLLPPRIPLLPYLLQSNKGDDYQQVSLATKTVAHCVELSQEREKTPPCFPCHRLIPEDPPKQQDMTRMREILNGAGIPIAYDEEKVINALLGGLKFIQESASKEAAFKQQIAKQRRRYK